MIKPFGDIYLITTQSIGQSFASVVDLLHLSTNDQEVGR